MTGHPVSMTPTGPPETILDPEPADALAALARALDAPEAQRRDEISAVVAQWPTFLDAWARLGEHARDDVEAYADFRVAYHRGLDRLPRLRLARLGLCALAHETNRGFLRGLIGLGQAAARIGESSEAQRCAEFVRQLDPDLDPDRSPDLPLRSPS